MMKKLWIMVGASAAAFVAISAYAALKLLAGCNIDGGCAGTSNPATWAAFAAPLVAAIGAIVFGIVKSRKGKSSASPLAESASAPLENRPSSEGDDEGSMSSRLSRLRKTAAQEHEPAHVVPGYESDLPYAEGEPATDGDEQAFDDDLASNATHDTSSAADEWGDDIEDSAAINDVAFNDSAFADAAFDSAMFETATMGDGESDAIADDSSAVDVAARWAWLWEETDGYVPLMRSGAETGFPWNVAGLDRLANAVRGSLRLHDISDYACEVDAWRSVVREFAPATPVGRDDSVAITEWFNELSVRVASTGQQAAIIGALHAAMEALRDDAADEPLIAAALPEAFPQRTPSWPVPQALRA